MAKQENNRTRVTIPIQGIDTSTPDLTVPDGKCEELHNLRWAAGAWHDVPPLAIKQHLSPAPGYEEWFGRMTVVYQHPAAGDDVRLATYPNSDGTINLCQFRIADDGTCRPFGAVNPITEAMIGTYDPTDKKFIWQVSYRSSVPVASDISFRVRDNNTQETFTLTIPKGDNTTDILRSTKTFMRLSGPTPEADDKFSYQLLERGAAPKFDGTCFVPALPSDIRITHFGNILILLDNINKQITHYYLNNGFYENFIIPTPPVIHQNTDFSADYSPRKTKIKFVEGDLNPYLGVKLYNQSTGSFYIPQTSGDFFWGEICCLAVFQMTDGRLLSPSALLIAASEPFYAGNTARTYIQNGASKTMSLSNVRAYQEENGDVVCRVGVRSVFSFMICPWLTVTIPENINTNLIKQVNIYSTRINPIWESEKLKSMPKVDPNSGDTLSGGARKYFADNKLPQQPFYLVKSIPLAEFSEKQYEFYLTGYLLENLEAGTAYEPVDAHAMIFTSTKEYNSRLHTAGDLTARLFNGFGNDFFNAETSNTPYALSTRIVIDDMDYYPIRPTSCSLKNNLVYHKILSYPDFRAENIYGYTENCTSVEAMYKLHKSLPINFAYAINTQDMELYLGRDIDYVKYSAKFPGEPTDRQPAPSECVFVLSTNKLRVSALNNPFSFPLENSYAIGTDNNRILAINSAAIEMSDAKFGEFPLYVFTEEGIFTLQSGSGEVLYSSVVPLNYDRIVNPATLAVNHNILYMTARGIQAMFSNESKLISGPINDRHDLPPLDYLRGALMCYQHPTNEVIVWNREADAGRAYVFSLDNGCWSTRDFEGRKLNTDELVVRRAADAVDLLDLNSETRRPDAPVPVRLVSRPIKFGSAEFKRLETFIPRFRSAAPQAVRLLFEGSADLVNWFTLRDTAVFPALGDATVRRFPHSVRYLRVTLEADTDTGTELTQFDAEYYLRFVHRLR